jgi:hypothetical protein
MTRQDFPGHPGDGYFAAYMPRIGNQITDIPGATVQRLDD